MFYRIIFNLIVLMSLATIPWWAVLLLFIIGSFLFKNYFEIIFGGLVIDAIYGSSIVFENFPYIFTFTSLFIVIISDFLKKQILIYND